MPFDITSIATDLKAEVEGRWTPDLGKGLKLLLARIGNTHYTKLMTEAAREQTTAFGSATLDEETAMKKLIKVFAQSILLGWEGLTEGETPVAYSVEKAEQLMTDYPDFFRLVQTQARNADLFRKAKMDEAAGN